MKKKGLALLATWLLPVLIFAQLTPTPISIPMRDGQHLAADLYLPDAAGNFPVILIQTPYNKNFYQLGLPLGIGQDLANSNYAFVVMDWRCFYGSLDACTADLNRGEDGYDAVEWIAEQDWSNGKIGTWGPSALGQIQYETAREQPPHLVCAMPEVASPQTTFKSYYPGGSLRVEWLETLGVLFGTAGFDLVIMNPFYNLIWQFAESSTLYPEEIEVPMFLVAGWYDINTEDCFFMMDQLQQNSDPSVQTSHKMVIGPWVHGGTGQAAVGTTVQGELSYPAGAGMNAVMGMQFFDYYLREQTDNGWAEVAPFTYFQMGEDEWRESSVWPPVGVEVVSWYGHPDGSLQTYAPSESEGSFTFSYDPEDPSPTVGGKTLNLALDQGPYDQGPMVESREDAIIFSSPILTQPVQVHGRATVRLAVSTDRLDTDFTVRLTDVYPDGRSMLLGEGIQRLRFRDGHTEAEVSLAEPNQIYQLEMELEELGITFLEGHRIRLIVSSSNYPRYNRNMNTGADMYPNGEIDILVNPLIATNTIYANSEAVTSLELPLVDFDPTLSVAEWERKSPMLFPNPAQEEVHWQDATSGRPYHLYDQSGRLRLQGNIGLDGVIALTSLPVGCYWLYVQDQAGEWRGEKLLIAR